MLHISSGVPLAMDKYLKKRKIILSFKENIEPHEILLDKLAKRREEVLGISEQKFETPLLKKILDGLFFFSIFLFLVLFAKTFQLGIIEGKNFSVKAEENKYIFHNIQAERGVIYDRNFNQLVFNQPNFDLICDKEKLPQQNPERSKVLEDISQILKINTEDLEKLISEDTSPQVLLAQGLNHQGLITLETKIASGELPGLEVENNTSRQYKEGEAFSHILGYTGKIRSEELKAAADFYSITDYIGRAGLEKSYEETLRKIPGKLKIERDAQGRVISKETILLPKTGNNLVLFLDFGLQEKIKEELEKELQAIGGKKAAAVALDPQTGGVMALVSLPSFDNNLFSKGADPEALKKVLDDPAGLQPLFNRAISGGYLTGSTIKPLIASAALEEKIISPDKKINCTGKIIIQNPDNPSASSTKKDWTIHSWTNMRKAIAESCNVYFYTVGGGYGDQKGLGPTKIKEYLELFGWNEKTGIDLPGETAGFVPDKEWKKETWGLGWWDGDTYNLSIGQGFLQISPLEVAVSFASIANGGKLLEPKVVKEIVDNKKNVIEETEPTIIRENFIEPENLQIVREGMRQAVTAGSASLWLNQLPVSAAAKTGTAELGKDKYGNAYYNNWVTVFAPYENPQIVLTIVIEDIKGVQTAALPAAKGILEWYFSQR